MYVLVINCGSSSLKYELFDMDKHAPLAKGLADRVSVGGGKEGVLTHTRLGDGVVYEHDVEMPSHDVAVTEVFAALTDPRHGVLRETSEIGAVGHRVVHGGEDFQDSVLINGEVTAGIERMGELAPLHNPANLLGIHACMKLLPHVPQAAVFDTSFHSTLPKHAYMYALPYELYESSRIRRYGFHGTSHYYVSRRAEELLRERGIANGASRIVTMHLGNGASVAAVKGGRCVDTSMGLTPAEGLVMGTRCGDIDPAIITHLERTAGLSADQVDDLINKKSGLLGITGGTSDMRDVQAAAHNGGERARLAIDIYCYRARKYIGAYAAAMGGIDAVVFTAGTGENQASIRAGICQGLDFLGIKVDERKNQAAHGECDISQDGSSCAVFVIPTNEELVIARETQRLVQEQPPRRQGRQE
jgi:acetate kinase